jgi:hypothetical protein
MWYGKVESGAVTRIKKFDGPDAVKEPKLVAHGWLIGEDGDSSYDPITQTRATSPSYDIQATKIVRTYAVTDKPLADAKAAGVEWIRAQAQSVILGQYPLWIQLNCSLGIYASAVTDPMKTHISNVIAESNDCEDDVEAAETVAAVRAVSPTWPEE